MSTAAERAQAKSKQIRSAAQTLFLEQGFERTTTDAIAAAAPVSKETLYRYYPSKEDLLAECLRDLIEKQSPATCDIDAKQLESREALREALLALAQRIVRTLVQPDYLALARVVIAETPNFPHLGRLFQETVAAPVLHVVGNLLQGAHDSGVADVPDPEAAARLFVGALLTHTLLEGLLGGDPKPPMPAKAQIARIVDVHMRAIEPRPTRNEGGKS